MSPIKHRCGKLAPSTRRNTRTHRNFQLHTMHCQNHDAWSPRMDQDQSDNQSDHNNMQDFHTVILNLQHFDGFDEPRQPSVLTRIRTWTKTHCSRIILLMCAAAVVALAALAVVAWYGLRGPPVASAKGSESNETDLAMVKASRTASAGGALMTGAAGLAISDGE